MRRATEATLKNAAQLWLDAGADHELALQRALFPEGANVKASGFATSATCLMFSELPPFVAANLQVASPTIFEADKLGGPSSQPVDQTRKDNELHKESDDRSGQEQTHDEGSSGTIER